MLFHGIHVTSRHITQRRDTLTKTNSLRAERQDDRVSERLDRHETKQIADVRREKR